MKISIQLKLFLSYAGMLLVSLALVGWTIQLSLKNQFMQFRGKFPGRAQQELARSADLLLETLEHSLFSTTLIAGAIAILISLLVSYFFTRPIQEVIDATDAIACGNYKRRIRTHSNDELGELTKSVNAMAECLGENQRLQQDLITNVAHELATPLTNIRGYLEAINDGLIKGKKKDETLLIMSEEANRLSDMLTEVRELVHIQAPTFKVDRRKVDMDKLVKKVMKQMEPQLCDHDLKFVYENKAKNSTHKLDHDRMIQVLQNLMNNAIKYSPKNGVITLTLTDKKFSVSDTGRGIPKKDLPHLFERFYRADQSRSRKTGGLGIGLAIVQEVMEAQNGRVSVKSKVGKGTTFTLWF